MAIDFGIPVLPDVPASLTLEGAEAILLQLAGGKAAEELASARSRQHEINSQEKPESISRPQVPAAAAKPLSADNLRALLEAIPDALVVVDGFGRITLVNAQTEHLFGYRRDELIGQTIEILVPERLRDAHVGQRDGYFANPHVRPMGQGLALVGRRKDGHEVPVEISLSPLITDSGPLVVASVRDVTARRKADAQLQKMEQRYRTLVEGIPAVTFMAAMDEGVNELYVSPQIEELLGFSQREWVENPILWFTQLHPDDRPRWHEEFAETVSTGKTFRSEYRFVARDGRVVWVLGEAQVVRDETGRPLFLQGVAFDITGMKQAEEDLKELNQRLNRRVAERTKALEERKEDLERSNKELVEFAGVVAHDLKAPPRTMSNHIPKMAEAYRIVAQDIREIQPTMTRDVQKMVAAYQEGRLDAMFDDSLNRTTNAVKWMNTLIIDLESYSRVGTEGKEPTPTSCAEVVAKATEIHEAAIEECEANVIWDDNLPMVLAVRTLLTQLFQNLIGNALKYRSERPPRVEVSAHRQGDEWVIEVKDNGIGIDPDPKRDFLQKIFKLGTESRMHGRDKFPGSGIGLATCKKIVERHGGRIWANSPGPDQGTTISFTMPALRGG